MNWGRRINADQPSESLDSGLMDNRGKEGVSERGERHEIKRTDDLDQGG